MAERAEAIKVQDRERSLAPVVPVRKEEEPVPTTMTAMKERATADYDKAMDRAAAAYSAVVETSKTLHSDVKHWAQRLRNEKPLQVVAFVAGAGFVLGFFLRIWKSKRYA